MIVISPSNNCNVRVVYQVRESIYEADEMGSFLDRQSIYYKINANLAAIR